MRIVYLGTPDFAVAPLQNLIDNGYDVIAVVTNKDKPFGRKKILTPPPVKVLAQKYNIPVYQYDKIRNEGVEDMKALAPDLMITCAFGQILSQQIIDIAKKGVINIHASLLPKYRGASPIHYAILNGEEKTGVTIMKTDVGIDTGDMILQREIEIKPNETTGELFERLSSLGANLIIEALRLIKEGKEQYVKQDDSIASYSKIIDKNIALICWKNSAQSVFNQIRAFNPSPVAFTFFNGEKLKIFEAKVVDLTGKAGEIISCEKELIVACKEKAISILKIQKEGGKPLAIKEFLLGYKIQKGAILG